MERKQTKSVEETFKGDLMKKKSSMVIRHLEKDSKTWDKLSKEAKHEAESDRKLIRAIKHKMRRVV